VDIREHGGVAADREERELAESEDAAVAEDEIPPHVHDRVDRHQDYEPDDVVARDLRDQTGVGKNKGSNGGAADSAQLLTLAASRPGGSYDELADHYAPASKVSFPASPCGRSTRKSITAPNRIGSTHCEPSQKLTDDCAKPTA
jgi:hypothetical protein